VDLLKKTIAEPNGDKTVKIIGVQYRHGDRVEELFADSVVITTGGFANDHTESSLIKEFAPHLQSTPTTNGPWATGDGVKLCRAAGATLVDMDKIQLHPTGLIHPKKPADRTKFLGPEALRGSGGILLNQHGRRFVNELDLRSVVSAAIQKQGFEYPDAAGAFAAYIVLSAESVKLFGPASMGFYKDKIGLFWDARDISELATIIKCDVETLRNTLSAYEAARCAGICESTGKSVFPSRVCPESGPFIVGVVTPSIHYTMGGVSINAAAEVQFVDETKQRGFFGRKRPILGLFAAGEVTSGVHGANRLGGNSLLECVVFGRIAGDRAATVLQKTSQALHVDEWTYVTVREIRDEALFGHGSAVIRFNLPGAMQHSGIKIGQFVAIRGEWEGEQLVGYYSPITLPHDYGVIGLLVRTDKGGLKDWLKALRPGDAVMIKGCGGLTIDADASTKSLLFKGEKVRRFGLVAGGTGIAPMIQILRATTSKPYIDNVDEISLVYAAETVEELTYRDVLENFERESKGKFKCHFVLNNPPAGWIQGVGFIDRGVLTACLPRHSDDLLICICGPPVMQRVVRSILVDKLKHRADRVRTVDDPEMAKL